MRKKLVGATMRTLAQLLLAALLVHTCACYRPALAAAPQECNRPPPTVQAIWLDPVPAAAARAAVEEAGRSAVVRPPAALNNTVLVLPGVLSAAECAYLRAETDRIFMESLGYPAWASVGASIGDQPDEGGAPRLRRLSIRAMAPEALALALGMIKERVLPELERQAPAVIKALRLGVRACAAPPSLARTRLL